MLDVPLTTPGGGGGGGNTVMPTVVTLLDLTAVSIPVVVPIIIPVVTSGLAMVVVTSSAASVTVGTDTGMVDGTFSQVTELKDNNETVLTLQRLNYKYKLVLVTRTCSYKYQYKLQVVVNACVKYRKQIFIGVGDIHPDGQNFQVFCQFEQTTMALSQPFLI